VGLFSKKVCRLLMLATPPNSFLKQDPFKNPPLPFRLSYRLLSHCLERPLLPLLGFHFPPDPPPLDFAAFPSGPRLFFFCSIYGLFINAKMLFRIATEFRGFLPSMLLYKASLFWSFTLHLVRSVSLAALQKNFSQKLLPLSRELRFLRERICLYPFSFSCTIEFFVFSGRVLGVWLITRNTILPLLVILPPFIFHEVICHP